MSNRAIEGLTIGVCTGVICWTLIFAALDYLSLPTVAKDISGRCIYIEYSDGSKNYGCGDLPHKYNQIIVGGDHG